MFTIRGEQHGDVDSIRLVHETSFPSSAEARLVEALRAAGRLTVSLVAELDGRVVGHVGFSPVSCGACVGSGLAPIAVLPEHRRLGIADRLVREGLQVCRQLGVGFVVVLGDPDYYGRFGFRPASEWGLRDEYGGQDAFQAIELSEGAIPRDSGLVRYSPEFAALVEEPGQS